jgi:hypothetical protein
MSETRTIPLTKGYEATVDGDDYTRVSQFKWHANIQRRADGTIAGVYAYRSCPRQTPRVQPLHRFILGVTDSALVVDHRDHNGLNCQKGNLRPATRQQNCAYARPGKSACGFKGVRFSPNRAKGFVARIKVNRKEHHLGYFPTAIDAALAYDEAARTYFGEFALTNFNTEGTL